MKILSILIILSATYLAFTDNATTVKPEPKKELSKDTVLIMEFVKSDTLIQKYILNPTFRIQIREAHKQLTKKSWKEN